VATIEIDTSHGPAAVHLHPAKGQKAALILGHGAGGGVDAPDLVAATDAAVATGFTVALVEQPYRVAGKSSQPAASTIDAAWRTVIEELRAGVLAELPIVTGGRSAGARVACRTAEADGAAAVLCLAFPLQPPARKGKPPSPDRLDELDAVEVPTLVVQGERDRFGMPPAGPRREVVAVPGDHSLRKDPEAVGAAVRDWLPGVIAEAAPA
jgi:predicted alpha/beta-hydrolase family hydrolase